MAILQSTSITGSLEVTGSVEVNGDTTINGKLLGPGSVLTIGANSYRIDQSTGGVGDLRFYLAGGGGWSYNWYTNNNHRVRISDQGLGVGIGNTNPQERLHVVGNAVITDSNNLTGTYALKVADSNNNSILAVENDGKVGINTATPAYTMELGNVGAQLAINGSADNSGHIFLKNSAGEYTANAIGTNAYNTTYSTRTSRSHIFYFGGLGNSKLFNMGDNGSGTLIMQPQGFTSAEFRAVTLFQGASNLAGPTIYGDGNGIYEGVIINRSNRSNGYSPEGRILQVQATGSERFNITREGDTWAMGYMSASTYYGDGSNLTGIDSGSWDGSYTGSAEVSGSLGVTGSVETTSLPFKIGTQTSNPNYPGVFEFNKSGTRDANFILRAADTNTGFATSHMFSLKNTGYHSYILAGRYHNLYFGDNTGGTNVDTIFGGFRNYSGGYLILGGDPSNAQERLHVVGNTTITGSNNLTGTYALKVADSNNNSLLAVENDGKVGIGTDAPSEKLDVDGNIRFGNGDYLITKDSAGTYGMQMRMSGTALVINKYGGYGLSSYNIYDDQGNPLASVNAGHTMRGVNNAFIFGKNVQAPSNGYFGFQTYAGTPEYLAIKNSRVDSNNEGLSFHTRLAGVNSETMRIAYDGNVGIGTTSPQAKLHVNGSVVVDGSQRSNYSTMSFVYSGSNLTQVTSSFTSTQQITNLNYTGSLVESVEITGSDGVNKLYSITYDGNGNVSQITVS